MATFWPEGEGVLLCVDDESVFASLSVLLFVVHLGVLGVLWARRISVVPTTHQVQTPRSITARLGQESSSESSINKGNTADNVVHPPFNDANKPSVACRLKCSMKTLNWVHNISILWYCGDITSFYNRLKLVWHFGNIIILMIFMLNMKVQPGAS